MRSPPSLMVLLHSSDELYGADRMLLEIVAAVPPGLDVEVWLPTDVSHPPDGMSLCHELISREVRVRHIGLPIMRRSLRTPRGLAALFGRSRRLLRELRLSRPEAVYCTTSAAMLGAPVARAAGVAMVVGHCHEIWSRSDRLVLGWLAQACQTLLAISQAAADSLPTRLRHRAVIVPNGTPEPRQVVTLDGRTGALHFLVASRWNAWKGHRTLLDAWDRAGAPGHLTVLGGPPRSGDTVDVNVLVSRLARPKSVSVVGEVTDPSGYIEAADVVVVPSDRPEPFGLVAIEAFARGRSVVGSAAGGLLGIVTPGVDGWLFPPGDSEALARVLSGLNRQAVTLAGDRARRNYERLFTAEGFGQRWRAAVFSDVAFGDLPVPEW
jgi:glycosyltransferase involved in cell wall biosynthesis